MMGFKPVVQACAANIDNRLPFEQFREDYTTYHILLGNSDRDQDALDRAKQINSELFERYVGQGKPFLGYVEGGRVPYRAIDICDSHHILMSTMIANYKREYSTIIEIGAGYGNMIRLNQDIITYDKWIDIDLPFVLDLADWYLERGAHEAWASKVDFEEANNYESQDSDLVIGAHSLSELSMDDFNEYYRKIVIRGGTFFYSTHLSNCGAEMLRLKLDIISRDFTLISRVITEGGGVYNDLYVKNTPTSTVGSKTELVK
jgi:hypothetical protein